MSRCSKDQSQTPCVGSLPPASAASGANIAKPVAAGGALASRPTRECPDPSDVKFDRSARAKKAASGALNSAQSSNKYQKNVYWKLSVFLYNDDSIVMRKPLYTHRTPPFRKKRNSAPSTFKEPLNLDNCLTSLRCSGLYEGSITAWQFAACQMK